MWKSMNNLAEHISLVASARVGFKVNREIGPLYIFRIQPTGTKTTTKQTQRKHKAKIHMKQKKKSAFMKRKNCICKFKWISSKWHKQNIKLNSSPYQLNFFFCTSEVHIDAFISFLWTHMNFGANLWWFDLCGTKTNLQKWYL